MIELRGIKKTFKVSRRDGGIKNAVKSLFLREYQYIHALDDVSFTISEGEMVGYIGPNGAGKSSTIKIMSGILTPDSGECVINGRVPWRERTAHVKEIGVVFGQRSQLWWDVPVIDSLELLRDIYSVPGDRFRANLSLLSDMLDIGGIIRTPARQLSLGQRMRCEVVASLLHDPKILFLDEPTIGLDAVSKIAVREFIKKVNRERGTTVILTTHDMQDIDALTDRIILIGRGRILMDGALDELKYRRQSNKRLSVEYAGNFMLPEVDGVVLTERQGNICLFTVDTSLTDVSRAIALLTERAEVRDISVAGVTVEEIVIDMYREFGI